MEIHEVKILLTTLSDRRLKYIAVKDDTFSKKNSY